MGDLSKNFSKLEVQYPCGCSANKISPVLIEKLQKVRNIIGRPIIITSGVRCEKHNSRLKNSSMNSSHVPDACGIGKAVDIACPNSEYRYELIQVVQKYFNRTHTLARMGDLSKNFSKLEVQCPCGCGQTRSIMF
ncbi:D-Ala-D-Ala carboxypeptidase family metallohydrolase [Nitrospinaceae bacterium]|nr:D-Ala-D-Ala carboxypeptidase family metallohydrolase [Nitrospinaceae bacterium]